MTPLWAAIVLPQPAGEDAVRELRELLAGWAYRYSSQVCLEEDGICLEVAGSFGLFGPWPQLERQLRDDLAALELSHRIALAPTPLGARVLARTNDGMGVFDLEQLRRAVQGLAIADLALPERQHASLSGMGVRRVRQLLVLPRAGLIRRFGRELPEMLDRLLGHAPDIRLCYRPPDRFARRFEFDFDITRSPSLLFPLKRLIADLAAFLGSRDGGVQRFELLLEHESIPPTRIPVGTRVPERSSTVLFDLARLNLERQTITAPVVALGVVADELPAFVPLSTDLFDIRPAGALDWPTLQARLAARLGPHCLYQLDLHADPRPDYAQRRVASAHAESLPTPALPRPLWLLPQPRLFREAAPQLLAGPERIESGWWDGAETRRDYYLARTRDGQRAWIFCPPGQHGPYLLHGWFA